MGFVGNQMKQMMINQITKNNPNISPYITRIENGENYVNVLQNAIKDGAITRQQFSQAKPMLTKVGKMYGINVSQQDISKMESAFNQPKKDDENTFQSGFRF